MFVWTAYAWQPFSAECKNKKIDEQGHHCEQRHALHHLALHEEERLELEGRQLTARHKRGHVEPKAGCICIDSARDFCVNQPIEQSAPADCTANATVRTPGIYATYSIVVGNASGESITVL